VTRLDKDERLIILSLIFQAATKKRGEVKENASL
jgi:hypothetical protein